MLLQPTWGRHKGCERFLNAGDIMILADKETGVQYLFVWPVNSAGGLTVLVDENGKPILHNKTN